MHGTPDTVSEMTRLEQTSLRGHIRERGQTKLGMLTFALFIGILVFTGSQIIPFFYSYYELEGLFQGQAKQALHLTDDKIRKNIFKKIKDLGIPDIKDDDLRINRYDGKIVIELKYSEVFYIDLGEDRVYDIYKFDFNPRAETKF